MTLPRIITSAKFQASFVGTVLLAIPLIFTETDKNLDRAHKESAATAFTFAVAGLWGVSIGGTAHEDAAEKKANGPAQAPDVQVNTGTAAQNTQQAATPPAPTFAAPPGVGLMPVNFGLPPTTVSTLPAQATVTLTPHNPYAK